VVFIEAWQFFRRLRELAGDSAEQVLEGIQADLWRNPERGALVSGLRGIRKARAANPARGKGKRGGYRYFYLYIEVRGHIHLLMILDKHEQADLTASQRKALVEMVATIRAE
jgi:hypothetical protein